MNILGIDVGGSGIKGALVDLDSGDLASERIKLETPQSFTREEVAATIAAIIAQFKYSGPVGVGFPAAVSQGIVLTPPTALHYPGWVGKSVDDLITQATGCDITIINDADAAGLAEMRFGAGEEMDGPVMTFTLGTGVGCGMFMDGKLVPNYELGKLYLPGHTEMAELYMAGRIKKLAGLRWAEYGQRLNEYFQHIEHLFSPNLIIVGGGISKKHARFLPEVKLTRSKIVPAELLNEAGIVGAAVAAYEAKN